MIVLSIDIQLVHDVIDLLLLLIIELIDLIDVATIKIYLLISQFICLLVHIVSNVELSDSEVRISSIRFI